MQEGPDGPVLAAGDLRVPAPRRPDMGAGRKVIYGIRPEHLMLRDTGIKAAVTVVEPTGSETHLVLRSGGHDLTVVSRERLTVRPGDVVHL